eukprot:scpid60542/ scgid25093/ 
MAISRKPSAASALAGFLTISVTGLLLLLLSPGPALAQLIRFQTVLTANPGSKYSTVPGFSQALPGESVASWELGTAVECSIIGKETDFSAQGINTDYPFWLKDDEPIRGGHLLTYATTSPTGMSRYISTFRWPTTVTREHAGVYTCGAGYDLHAFEIRFFDIPRITNISESANVPKGSTKVLHCSGDGEEPLIISWYKNGIQLQRLIPLDHHLELRIGGPGQASLAGSYTCEIKNPYGVNTSRSVIISTTEQAVAPNVTVSDASSSHLVIQLQYRGTVANSLDEISGYRVAFRALNDDVQCSDSGSCVSSGTRTVEGTSKTTSTLRLSNLSGNAMYQVTVVAINRAGVGREAVVTTETLALYSPTSQTNAAFAPTTTAALTTEMIEALKSSGSGGANVGAAVGVPLGILIGLVPLAVVFIHLKRSGHGVSEMIPTVAHRIRQLVRRRPPPPPTVIAHRPASNSDMMDACSMQDDCMSTATARTTDYAVASFVNGRVMVLDGLPSQQEDTYANSNVFAPIPAPSYNAQQEANDYETIATPPLPASAEQGTDNEVADNDSATVSSSPCREEQSMPADLPILCDSTTDTGME